MTTDRKAYRAAPSRRVFLMVLVVLLLPVARVQAADIEVTASCSLKNAVLSANGDSATGGCTAGSGADTIIIRGNVSKAVGDSANGYEISSAITIEGRAGSGTANQMRTISARNNAGTPTNNRIFIVAAAGSLTMKSLRLRGGAQNGRGGAVSNDSTGTLSIADSEFEGNRCLPGAVTGCRGGAIYSGSGSTFTISNSSFRNNRAEGGDGKGGAIYTVGTTTLSGARFHDNSADGSGGSGGAIYIDSGTLETTITGAEFTNNSADQNGGALTVDNSVFLVENSVFRNNELHSANGEGGGAIYHLGSSGHQTKSYFESNRAHRGGALSMGRQATIDLVNNTFWRNQATAGVGGGASNTGAGGHVAFFNNTFVDNQATGGGNAVHESSVNGIVRLRNNIIAQAAGISGVACTGLDTTAVSPDVLGNNVIQDGSCAHATTIAVDPRLGGISGSGYQRHFPPRLESPAINAAVTPCANADILGTARPQGSACDLGSYELPLSGNLPSADFRISRDASYPLRVSFDAGASADNEPRWNLPLIYKWDFDHDPNNENIDLETRQARVTHSYLADCDPCQVKLTVESYNGSASASKQIPPVVAHPAASITLLETDGSNSLRLRFGAGAGGTRYEWNFGDAASSDNLGLGETIWHTFSAPGRYKVSLTALNTHGGRDSASASFAVGATPAAAKAAFSYAGDSLRVVFRSRSSGDDLGYSWDFGDGGATSPTQNPVHVYAAAGSYTVTLTVSNSVTATHSVSREVTVPLRWSSSSGSGGGRGSGGDEQDEAAEESKPQPATCAELPSSIAVTATYGLRSGIHCQHVAPWMTQLPDALNAVDVWAYVEQGAEVCFQGVGAIQFLDAAVSPRALHTLDAYSLDGMTCAEIDRPGTVVLIYSDQPAPPRPQPLSGQDAPGEQPRGLQDCMVTTTDILYFRQEPGGGLIILNWIPNSWLPKNATLTALARTSNWFKVDYYGIQGWISAQYATPQGACG